MTDQPKKCHVCKLSLSRESKDYFGQTFFIVGGGKVHGRCWRWSQDNNGRLIRVVKPIPWLRRLRNRFVKG